MTEKESCFIILPFRAEFKFIYYFLRELIEDKFNLKVETAEKYQSDTIHRNIIRRIKKATLVLCILTDSPEDNNNIIYEFGIAVALDKDPILIVKEEQSLPSDIKGYEYVRYDSISKNKFKYDIKEAIKSTLTDYEKWYVNSKRKLSKFNKRYNENIQPIKLEEFKKRVDKFFIKDNKNEPFRIHYSLLTNIIPFDIDPQLNDKIINFLNNIYEKDIEKNKQK